MVSVRHIGPGAVTGAHYDRRPVPSVLCVPNRWCRGALLFLGDRGWEGWATSLDAAGAGAGFM